MCSSIDQVVGKYRVRSLLRHHQGCRYALCIVQNRDRSSLLQRPFSPFILNPHRVIVSVSSVT